MFSGRRKVLLTELEFFIFSRQEARGANFAPVKLKGNFHLLFSVLRSIIFHSTDCAPNYSCMFGPVAFNDVFVIKLY